MIAHLMSAFLSFHGQAEYQADTANTVPFFQCTTLNLVIHSLRQFSMQVDSICNGVATVMIEGYKD